MANVIVYVDGYNLYEYVKKLETDEKDVSARELYLVWYDLRKLAGKYVYEGETLSDENIRFYTARPKGTKYSQRVFSRWIEILAKRGITTIKGNFTVHNKKHRYPSAKEKQTDVNIAVDLICGASGYLKSKDSDGNYSKCIKYDKAILISGDTDFVPAIQCVLANYPEKSILLLKPESGNYPLLKKKDNFSIESINAEVIKDCLFPLDKIKGWREELCLPKSKSKPRKNR